MAAAAPPTAPTQPGQARPWNNDFKHTDRERWICIYPAYLNSKRTLKEGRRIPKAKAVDNPVCGEIRDICAAAGLCIGVENKVYPRETEPRDIRFRGRVRVQLRNEDGTPCLPQFKDRMSLLLYVSELIPKLKTRQGQTPSSQQGASSSSSAASSAKGGQKRKGRK